MTSVIVFDPGARGWSTATADRSDLRPDLTFGRI